MLFIFELCDVIQYFAQEVHVLQFLGWSIYIFDFELNVMGEGDTKPVTNF